MTRDQIIEQCQSQVPEVSIEIVERVVDAWLDAVLEAHDLSASSVLIMLIDETEKRLRT
jgi:hypothetical protein